MQFKVGDKVSAETPGWCEDCTVIKMGYNKNIMVVRRADGRTPAIYKGWASIIKSKNQQLLFDFMNKG